MYRVCLNRLLLIGLILVSLPCFGADAEDAPEKAKEEKTASKPVVEEKLKEKPATDKTVEADEKIDEQSPSEEDASSKDEKADDETADASKETGDDDLESKEKTPLPKTEEASKSKSAPEASMAEKGESKEKKEETAASTSKKEANTAERQNESAKEKSEAVEEGPPSTKEASKTVEKAPPEKSESPQAQPASDAKKEASKSKRQKMISAGFGAPMCGFAYAGIIEGSGCANTSSNFLWGNIDLRFNVRLSEKFAAGGGLLQSFIYFDEFGVMGGHLVADFIWYAVPDYLYFKMDLIFGFPMFFALGPTMGHSFSVTKKVHIFIENQFLFMAVLGVYGFWQPTVGVSMRF